MYTCNAHFWTHCLFLIVCDFQLQPNSRQIRNKKTGGKNGAFKYGVTTASTVPEEPFHTANFSKETAIVYK